MNVWVVCRISVWRLYEYLSIDNSSCEGRGHSHNSNKSCLYENYKGKRKLPNPIRSGGSLNSVCSRNRPY